MSTATAAAVIQPTIYWCQDPQAIHIKVDVKEAEKATIELKVTGNTIRITAKSKLTPDHLYQLELGLYGPVLPTPNTQVHGHSFSVTFAKMTESSGIWPRLLADNRTSDKNKIKIDWDRWMDEEEPKETKEEPSDATFQRAKEQAELRAQYEQLQSRRMGGFPPAATGFDITMNPQLAAIPPNQRLKITYLLAYNMFIIVGIILILFLIAQTCWINYYPKALSDPISSTRPQNELLRSLHGQHAGGVENAFYHGLGSVHARVGSIAYFIQILASLEILHAAIGLIQGRVLPSFLLNGGRDIILFGCIAVFDQTQYDWSVGALYLIWCLGDLVRYIYYLMAYIQSSSDVGVVGESWFSTPILQALQNERAIKVMAYARYTLPLMLLPFGFGTELKVVYASLTEASQTHLFGPWSVADLLKVYCFFAYLLGAPFLYMAVLKQRQAKVRSDRSETKTASTKTVTPGTTTSQSSNRPDEKKKMK